MQTIPNKPNSLNIEAIEYDSEDYREIQKIKAQNNTKHSLADVKAKLKLSSTSKQEKRG